LHAGSVLTALASFLDARARQGRWLVRIEDLDPPRESKQAVTDILHSLEALGLTWDEEVLFQSSRRAAYEEALAALDAKNLVYACRCSRQLLAAAGAVYPGLCRDLQLPRTADTALRCRVTDQTIAFSDRLQGPYAQHLARDVGDFVIRRRDGLFAYQLAVVVDDAFQGITDVVRGMDLLDSTPRQIHLQQQLHYSTPTYAHVPVIINALGQKLGKQQYAAAVDDKRPGAVLVQALERLRQQPDPALADSPPETILNWALARWKPENLRGIKQIPEIEGRSSTAV
jgi:glutamyl-Q tRNA(Asp) synthetase